MKERPQLGEARNWCLVFRILFLRVERSRRGGFWFACGVGTCFSSIDLKVVVSSRSGRVLGCGDIRRDCYQHVHFSSSSSARKGLCFFSKVLQELVAGCYEARKGSGL